AGHALARLLVGRVLTAPRAVLRELDPVGRVSLGLLSLVVASLAVLARERDRDADTGLCHWGRLLGSGTPEPAPIRQDTPDSQRATPPPARETPVCTGFAPRPPPAGAADARDDRRPHPSRRPPRSRGAPVRGHPPPL